MTPGDRPRRLFCNRGSSARSRSRIASAALICLMVSMYWL